MERDGGPDSALTLEQLREYAKDLARIYQSEREKRKGLHNAHEQLKRYADNLKRTLLDLRSAHRELEDAYLDTIQRLVIAAEYKDAVTGDHILRMSRYSALIAELYGLSDYEVKNILYASPMHDIGKIGIPDSILLKPGKLTAEEFEIMKTHTTIGARILGGAKARILQLAEQIALTHHERWNGKGYPKGLSGNEIPLVGRITCLADVFDALTSKRPYKDAYPVEVALDIIKKERGEQFDPGLVDLFFDNIDEILRIPTQVHGSWLPGQYNKDRKAINREP